MPVDSLLFYFNFPALCLFCNRLWRCSKLYWNSDKVDYSFKLFSWDSSWMRNPLRWSGLSVKFISYLVSIFYVSSTLQLILDFIRNVLNYIFLSSRHLDFIPSSSLKHYKGDSKTLTIRRYCNSYTYVEEFQTLDLWSRIHALWKHFNLLIESETYLGWYDMYASFSLDRWFDILIYHNKYQLG